MILRPRSAWGAKAPLKGAMRLPATTFYVHHSVTRVTNDADADVRQVEAVGISRFGILSYSFLTHPARPGVIYEGAGLSVGAHDGGRNSTTFGLVFVGNYEELEPTDAQIRDGAELYAHLVHRGHLRPGAPIQPHRSYKSTACPGGKVMPRLGELKALAADLVAGRRPAQATAATPVPVSNPEEDAMDARQSARALELLEAIAGEVLERPANVNLRKMVSNAHHAIAAPGARLDAMDGKLDALAATLAAGGSGDPQAIADAVVKVLPRGDAEAVVDAIVERLRQ